MKDKFTKYFKGDTAIWVVVILLSILSMLTVYSATGSLAYKKMGGNTSYYLFRHLGFLVFGFGLVYVIHNVSYKVYFTLSQLLIYLTIPLLAWTLFRGVSLNEAARWVTVPGTGISFQTSDFAKLTLIMYVARLLSAKQENDKERWSTFKSIILWVFLVCGLILPANFSTSAILFTICLVLMFIGRTKLKYIFGLIGIGIVGLTLFIIIALHMPSSGRVGTWKARIEGFMSDDSDSNYQSNSAKTAIVNGGFFGRGPGNSIQRNVLPHPYSDFIYAIIIEEYGLAGGLAILLLYLFFLFRVGIIVRKSERTFPALLVVGLAFSLVFQALINMGVAVNVFPVTGQTLPFVSMGGTSIVFTAVAIGIILNVSRSVQAEGIAEGTIGHATENLSENNVQPELITDENTQNNS